MAMGLTTITFDPVLLVVGFTGVALVFRVLWRLYRGDGGPFVTLHASQDSAVLIREGNAPGVSFAQLVRDQIPALGPKAKWNGVWWLPTGDAQTAYCSIGDFSKVDPIVYERKFLQLPDQGVLALDITPPLSTHPLQDGENVALIVHGLTGGSHEAYVRAVLASITPSQQSGGLGVRAVVLNFRGCNGSPVVTPRLYHAGSSDDVKHVVLWICYKFPGCRIFGVGFSLGANILAKYAGEEGEKCPLQGIVTMANPWDFVAGNYYLPATFLGRHMYRYVLGGALRALLQLHHRIFLEASESPISHAMLEDVFQRRKLTLREYDDLITAPMYGFKNALDYYDRISSSKLVQDIRIPCLAMSSRDDPITGRQGLPINQVPRSPYLVLAVTKYGGHLGWFEHAPGGGIRRWFVKPVKQFLATLIEYRLQQRQKPGFIRLGNDFVLQEGCEDVGFRELSPEQSEFVVSGTKESKLFSGW